VAAGQAINFSFVARHGEHQPSISFRSREPRVSAANGRYSLCRAEHSAVGCTFTDHVVVDLHACNGALNSDYTLLLVARSLLLPGD
jgi:hypothetical protein